MRNLDATARDRGRAVGDAARREAAAAPPRPGRGVVSGTPGTSGAARAWRLGRMALRLALPLALLAVLWHVADGPAALARLAAVDPRWVALAAALSAVQTVVCAVRWRLTAGRLGLPLRRGRAVGEYFMAQFLNQTLPGGMLGDAARAVRARGSAGLARSGQAVVIERLSGQIALAAVTLAGFAGTLALPGGIDWPGGTAGRLAGGLAALAGLAGLVWLLAAPLAQTRLGRLPGLAGFGGAMAQALLGRRVWPVQAALGLTIVALNLGAFAASARAIGTPLPAGAVLTLIPLILVAMLLPITVAGWGWREGAAAALFPLAGATAAEGLAASIVFGLTMLLAALPGALWMLRPAPAPASPASPASSPAPARATRRP